MCVCVWCSLRGTSWFVKKRRGKLQRKECEECQFLIRNERGKVLDIILFSVCIMSNARVNSWYTQVVYICKIIYRNLNVHNITWIKVQWM